MKSKALIKKLKKFSISESGENSLSEEDFERCLNLIFRYLATLPVDQCIDTFNNMIKTGMKINEIEGRLKEKLKKAKGSKGIFGWTRPFTSGFDYIWQETARIFNPSSYKL